MTEVRPTVRVLPTPEAVARAAATEIAGALDAAITARGVAHWSTTGGSSAPGIYRTLRVPPLRDAVRWERVHVWWGDDRYVPAGDPLSNVRPLVDGLLDGEAAAVFGPMCLHPVPVAEALAAGTGPAGAAAAYGAELRANVAGDTTGTPILDVVVVGMGPDGHVLSVFPGSSAWDDPALCVAVPAPTHVEPHVARVTMHPRVLAAARRVLVVASGAGKAEVLGRAFSGDDARELPVRAARLPHAVWLLDAAAASGLPPGVLA